MARGQERGACGTPHDNTAHAGTAGYAERADALALHTYPCSDPDFDPRAAAQRLLDGARERGADAKNAAEEELDLLDLPAREAEQRVRRASRGAERDELLAALEELASWYRDLVVTAVGAERAVVHADRLAVLAQDGTTERLAGAERACEIMRETWRAFEEFNLSPPLALEALFVKLRRELGAIPALA